jgi:KaiC/GvpD/RAD55 family RecA-like ATPase
MYRYKTGIPSIDQEFQGLRAATNILVLAPSLTYADMIAFKLARPDPGEWTIVMSTDERASDVVDSFKRQGASKSQIGVIDAITKSSVPNVGDTSKIKFVTSPMDLTGMGIKFSRMAEDMWKESVDADPPGPLPPPVRFCINSLSTLLMYTRLEVIYRFLHVITARVKKLEGVGIYVLNSESFDDKTLSTIKQLMSMIVEVKTVDVGMSIQRYFRIVGIQGTSTPWMQFSVIDGQLVVHG